MGSSATATLQTDAGDAIAGRVLTNGAHGLGGPSLNVGWDNTFARSLMLTSANGAITSGTIGIQIAHSSDPANYNIQIAGRDGAIFHRSKAGGTFLPWQTFYHTGNTTKSSDGTLKAASPVTRIVASQEASQRADIAEDGFSWCGCGTANAEAEGITISRLDIGVYVLAGSAGLASEGWQLLPPMDPGGMGELGVVEAEQTESGGLTVRLFRRKYMLNDEGEIIKTKGELMDVPANSWIDVRLDMPSDSLFNQRMNQELQP